LYVLIYLYDVESDVQGVEGSVILDGRVPHAVLLQLLSDKAVGTLVTE
jgi:acetylglutamate kinase